VQGKFLRTGAPARGVHGAEPLFAFFEEEVAPYLGAEVGRGLPLASPSHAEAVFRNVRARLDPEARGVVDVLEDLCSQRRQFDHQARLHAWLHGWLCVHVPLSVAMFVLMLAHIYLALRYL
jgi:hypothetical protein